MKKKILIAVVVILLIAVGYFLATSAKPSERAEKSEAQQLKNIPLKIEEGHEYKLSDGQLTIYTKDRWCETTPTLFGIGLSWDDLVEALLIHLGTLHENEERELSIYFLGVSTDEGTKMGDYIASETDALGYHLAGKDLLDYRINDYYKALRTIIATHPDALIVFNPYPTGDLLLEQIAKLQITSDMTVAVLNEAVDIETIKRLGKGLEGLKIAGGKDKKVIIDSIKTSLQTSIAAESKTNAKMTPEELANRLLSLKIASPFGELIFSPENFLLEQPIEILRWDGTKLVEAEDSGFARHRGKCAPPPPPKVEPNLE